VNLKKGTETLGSYAYDDILTQLKKELDLIIASGAG
jgi:(E)-4-hydroxy-3-methylbut-2-enyl-diphosphate synthase